MSSLWFWFTLHLIFSNPPNTRASPFMAKLIDDLFLGYDKRLRPHFAEQPLEVSATAHVISVSGVDEISRAVTVSIYLRQHWMDPRLKYESPKQNITDISLNPENMGKVWSPDTFIVNEIKSYRNDVTMPNEIIRISPIGDIIKSSRLTITALCPMDLRKFPFNELQCNLEFESYNHKTEDLYYTWKSGSNSTLIGTGLGTQSYNLIGAISLTHQIHLQTGNYSRLVIKMKLQRLCCRYIFSTYLPTILLVLFSLMTLWIENMKISTIISFLNMSVLFILTTIHNNAADTPKVSYLTALDIHILLCVIFVSCVILVNVTMFYFVKKAARLTAKKLKNRSIKCKTAATEECETLNSSSGSSGKPFSEKITGIVLDILSNVKYFLLACFVAIEVVYWIYYLF